MANAIFSSICRVDDSRLLDIAEAGVVDIPADVLAPRQIKITGNVVPFAATVKEHRGQLVTTVTPEVARQHVDAGHAEYLGQKLLSYDAAAYVADPDVDAEEAARVEGFDLVVVAIIGDSRSALAVCRNIVSGCQEDDALKADAEGALEASRILLIEE